MNVTFKVDTTRLKALLDDVEKKQVPFATSMALNATAFQIQRAENAETKDAFKHPRPFSQKAFAVIKSTKATQRATIYLKPDHSYIAPFILGGKHELPGKGLINPKDIRLDQYGQFRKGQIGAMATNPNVFVGTVDGVAGFWLRVPGKRGRDGREAKGRLRLLARFGENLDVKRTLPFLESAAADASANFSDNWWAAFTKAMRTAKR